jgi:hypothetical protein
MVTEPEDIFPDPELWVALQDPASEAFKTAYLHFRPQVTRSVVSEGGSIADGSVFYRVAFIHLARLVHAGKIPEGTALPGYLEALAKAQFHDWRTWRRIEPAPDPADETDTPPPDFDLPDSGALSEMRMSIWARRQFFRLPKEDRYRIQELADDATQAAGERRFELESEAVAEGYGTPLASYKNLLKDYENQWSEVLPAWAVTALTDAHFVQVWDRTQLLEQQRTQAIDAAPKTNQFWRNAFVLLGIITVIAIGLQWYFRPKTTGEVFKDNFSAPESLLSDLAMRQAQSPDKDSLGVRPAFCDEAFAAADEAYRDKKYQMAAAELAQILDDSSQACHSDAYFYLAIIGLQMDEPGLTIECLSNIEDLSRYGEDIYWYQALAFVKLATQNPLMQEKAVRAVTRVISNTEIPERREQAEKMLRQLND